MNEFHDASKALIDAVISQTLFIQEHGVDSPKLLKVTEAAYDKFVEVGIMTFYRELADK